MEFVKLCQTALPLRIFAKECTRSPPAWFISRVFTTSAGVDVQACEPSREIRILRNCTYRIFMIGDCSSNFARCSAIFSIASFFPDRLILRSRVRRMAYYF